MSLEKAMTYAEASLRLEGKTLIEEQKSLVKSSLTGEITHEEFVRRALELSKNTK